MNSLRVADELSLGGREWDVDALKYGLHSLELS